MTFVRRFSAACAAAITAVALTSAPALAAPPTNDVIGGAEVIAGVPFSVSADTSEATTDANDAELNEPCGAPAMDASVWYSFTAPADDTYLADASASAYSSGVFVATGDPGSFTVIACGPELASWPAAANETYWIVVIDDQADGGGNGGAMQLTVDVAPPPPALDLTVNPVAHFDSKSGSATVTGTITCGEDAEFAFLEAQLTQRVGRVLIRGFGGIDVICDGTSQDWALQIFGDNGLFKGGKAATVTFGAACGAAACSEYLAETTIQLKGKK